MKEYYWVFGKNAVKKFKKLDIQTQTRIINWLDFHISGIDDPRKWGRPLEGDLQTFWRYRIGKYRVIANIHDNKFIVEVIKVAKRNDVYKK